MMNLDEKLGRVVSRYDELAKTMSAEGKVNPQEFAKLSKEYSDLTPIAQSIVALKKVQSELADVDAILSDASADAELKKMAESERQTLKEKLPELEQKVKVLLLPKDEADAKNAILEVRAGTGGEEAALFASDLFRMYQRYAENHGWKFEVMSISETGIEIGRAHV
jgi:peptide chain release factor 1